MGRTVNARIAPHLKQRIAAADATSAWALAAGLIPEQGVKAIQSSNARARAQGDACRTTKRKRR